MSVSEIVDFHVEDGEQKVRLDIDGIWETHPVAAVALPDLEVRHG